MEVLNQDTEAPFRIFRHIEQLCELDRVMCSPDYDQALEYIKNNLKCPANWIYSEEFAPGSNWWGWQVPPALRHWKDGRDDPRIFFSVERPLKILHVLIPGNTEKEIVFVTHVCHPRPSANDNASGPAMMVELVNHYAQIPPEYSLRFLFTAEYWGTLAFFHRHDGAEEHMEAGISLDMVGADPEKSGCGIVVDEIPHNLTNNLDLILYDQILKRSRGGGYREIGKPVPLLRCDFQTYTGGSDHYILNDSSIGVPSTCLNTYPDRFYHLPEDTPDKISLDTLKLFYDSILAGLELYSSQRNDDILYRIQLVLNRYQEQTGQLAMLLILKTLGARECAFRLHHYYRQAQKRLKVAEERSDAFELSCWYDQLSYAARTSFHRLRALDERIYQYLNPNESGKLRLADGFFKNTGEALLRKTFKGPLSRNRLYTLLDDGEKNHIEKCLQNDPLFYHKMDLALNFVPCESFEELSYIIRVHYGGESYTQRLELYLDMLTRYGLLERL